MDNEELDIIEESIKDDFDNEILYDLSFNLSFNI